jgi:hypothetical protein
MISSTNSFILFGGTLTGVAGVPPAGTGSVICKPPSCVGLTELPSVLG